MIEFEDRDFVGTLFEIIGRTETPVVSSVYVTPFRVGADVAGLVIAVQGSPPRATLLVPINETSNIYPCWGSTPAVVSPGTRKHDEVREWLMRNKLVDRNKYIGPMPDKLSMPIR